MANPVCEVLITDDTLHAPPQNLHGSGAAVDFLGVVRPLEQGREISGIQYEAHRAMAMHQMEHIARKAIEKFGLNSALIHHRVGFVQNGEASVFVRTTSRNRAEAYQASQWMMDELKKKVPIWKRPQFKASEQIRSDTTEPVATR